MPLFKKPQNEAPSAAKDEWDAAVRFLESKGVQAFDDEGLPSIKARSNEAAAEACGADETRVIGTEYAFQGMPASLESGFRLMRFDNTGEELHEMIFLRKKPATTETFDQILAREDEEQAKEKVDEAGFLFGFPGTAADVAMADDDVALVGLPAGQYAIVCFIPVGLTPDAAEAAGSGGAPPEGPPHFARGMKTEFTVR